jgi:secondary thiamine-phosphate synthase enzyme
MSKHTDGMLEHTEGMSSASNRCSDSHVKTSLFGPGLTLIVHDGELVLGRWQGVFLTEWDGPRTREVAVRVMKG